MPTAIFPSNVIIADADYIDRVAFDFTVNYERMLDRQIPLATMSRWLECIALDGGMEPGENNVHVFLIYDNKEGKMKSFYPSDLTGELTDHAFQSPVGEFVLTALPVLEDFTTKGPFFCEVMKEILSSSQVERLMVVGDLNAYGDDVRKTLSAAASSGKKVTLFTESEEKSRCYATELLGFSVSAALGVGGDEFHK